MQASTLTQLNSIARAGANKMTETDKTSFVGAGANAYAVAATATDHVYRVTNAEGTTYRVSIKPGATSCACKFYNENRFNRVANHGGFKADVCTCKHIEYLREREYWDARSAEEDARELARADAEGLLCRY